MSRRKKFVPTESDWDRLFAIRCRTKQGGYASPDEISFCEAMLAADASRYARMNQAVFDATKPVGAR